MAFDYPYTLKFNSSCDFSRVWRALIAQGVKGKCYAQPPKEWQSSSYRMWGDYYKYTNPFGTEERASNFLQIIFRDEEDYLIAVLMK